MISSTRYAANRSNRAAGDLQGFQIGGSSARISGVQYGVGAPPPPGPRVQARALNCLEIPAESSLEKDSRLSRVKMDT